MPPGNRVRPTPDRAREALFSILMARLEDAVVLDLFAGTGCLGFEALSRGAAGVTFVESHPTVVRELQRTIRDLDAGDRCRILTGTVEFVLGRSWDGPGASLVFADPPYAHPPGPALIGALVRSGALSDGGTLVLEREATAGSPEPPVPDVVRTRSVRYGRVAFDFYDRIRRS